MKRTSRAANLFHVSETETYAINLVLIGLLIAKVFLKYNINFFVHIFFMQLFLSFLHYIGPKKILCTTKEFFLIESAKICDDLNNENEYLCSQLNCLNQIKCHKNHFLYLKLILLLSVDISLNPGPVQNNLPFYTFKHDQFTAKNWWTKRNGKNIKPNGYWYYRNEIK